MQNILGIGLVTNNMFSSVNKGQSWSYDSLKKLHSSLKENGIIREPIKDFGRMDILSKMTVASLALAISDSSEFSDQSDRSNSSDFSDFGILGAGDVGSLASNIDYFKDYVDSGRKMGRGNLFVYTLPSTALAASAMAFGFKGPTLYEMYADTFPNTILKNAEKIILDQKCRGLAVVIAEKNKIQTLLVDTRR